MYLFLLFFFGHKVLLWPNKLNLSLSPSSSPLSHFKFVSSIFLCYAFFSRVMHFKLFIVTSVPFSWVKNSEHVHGPRANRTANTDDHWRWSEEQTLERKEGTNRVCRKSMSRLRREARILQCWSFVANNLERSEKDIYSQKDIKRASARDKKSRKIKKNYTVARRYEDKWWLRQNSERACTRVISTLCIPVRYTIV